MAVDRHVPVRVIRDLEGDRRRVRALRDEVEPRRLGALGQDLAARTRGHRHRVACACASVAVIESDERIRREATGPHERARRDEEVRLRADPLALGDAHVLRVAAPWGRVQDVGGRVEQDRERRRQRHAVRRDHVVDVE